MVPVRSAAACMASPRSATRRTPSSKARAPAAIRAVYSPRLWPGGRRRLDAEALDGVEHDEAGDEGGELGVVGALAARRRRRGAGAPDVAARHGGGLGDELPGGVVAPGLAHAGLLGPLAGEGEGDHRWAGTSGRQGSAGRAGRRVEQGDQSSDQRGGPDVSRVGGLSRGAVRREGFEPSSPCGQRGLSPPCLPVPAPPRMCVVQGPTLPTGHVGPVLPTGHIAAAGVPRVATAPPYTRSP